ncbi:MAG TPA: tannase/feruloyl esterase family alpha/beta hydrolase [Bryobacteraceae bacterium]|nr:tannase/feruloyl esterase family alpha/beta hydrolase [Bryobacteraceae bacterium]
MTTIAPLLLLFALAGIAYPQNCERLKDLKLPDTTINLVESVPAGLFTFPGGAATSPKPQVSARCRVSAVIKPSSDSEIEIELWMPTSDWNGKFLAVGNGGWSGSINYSGLVQGLRDRYATASTDTGHKGGSGSFVLGHPEKVIDFGHRAVHEMTVKAKAIIHEFYGSAPRRSYWNGCSSGGKQGLKEAQMYPADYDGIIAGAPANNWSKLSGSLLNMGVTNLKDTANTIPRAKLSIIHNAVLAACDAIDGVNDGILNDPRQCAFDPATLTCRGADSPDCLTPQQVETARAIYSPLKDQSGKVVYPGLARSTELAWAPALGGPNPFGIAFDHFRYFVHEDANWDWRKFDPARDVALSEEKDKHIAAVSPDLKAFKARGGKLLLWHGWIDQLITPENTINYYNSVLGTMGPKQDDWMRLFMAPGMLHCSGGPGPDHFNALAALERWVEKGIAPTQILAYHVTDNRVDMSRPLCPYPQVAEYSGNGSIYDAANFVCKEPRAQKK